MSIPAHSDLQPNPPSSGGRLLSPDGRCLPFRGGSLSVDAAGGLCRVVLRQRFVNPYKQPLRVVYQVPLPADAAVAGYAFELQDRRIVGRIEGRQAAREAFEEAILDGRTAALLEQERSSLFTQEIGNLPAGAEIVCELLLDQTLEWGSARDRPEDPKGGWTWRFPTVIAPRFLGQAGRVPDSNRVVVDVAESGTAARMTLSLRIRDTLTGPASSPSHELLRQPDGSLSLPAQDGAPLDRDIVVRWPVAAAVPGLSLDIARAPQERSISDHACGLLTIVPPALPSPAIPRDLVILLDTSGSMSGMPLRQAVAVSSALIDSLGAEDQLQIVEFSTRPRAWGRGPVRATPDNKAAATAWLKGLRAGGGTQMKGGVLAALACLRDEAQRQVLLVTDGLIGFEQEIVRAVARDLPRGCRVHTLGIGSAVNRSLLSPVARAGGGIEFIIGVDEDPDLATQALVAATACPQIVDLEVSGSALLELVHHRPPDLMATRPARLALRLNPHGGSLLLRGHTAAGDWEQTLEVPPTAAGDGSPALTRLVGRQRVEEAELRGAVSGDWDDDWDNNVDHDVQSAVDDAIENLGLAYQIATRCTSWVAISERSTVDPTAPSRTERVPQALPYGSSVVGLGLRAATSSPPPAPAAETVHCCMSPRMMAAPQPSSKERFFDARVVLAKRNRLVLELVLPKDVALNWCPRDADVTVLLYDGDTRTVALDRSRSTSAQWLADGDVLRVVLNGTDLASLLPRIDEVLIELDTASPTSAMMLLHLQPITP